MKKRLLPLVLLLFACSGDDENSGAIAEQTIEGRWLWSPGFEAPANTMYEFLNGTRYTYYCDTTECDESYWNTLELSDAIPGTETYTYEDNVLTIDLNFGNEFSTTISFECNGGKVNFQSSSSSLYRIGVDHNCN